MNSPVSHINRKGSEKHIKMIVLVSLALLLIIPGAALIISFQDHDGPDVDYVDEGDSATGDMSMDANSRQTWEDYLSSAPTIEFKFKGKMDLEKGIGGADTIELISGLIEDGGFWPKSVEDLERLFDQIGEGK